MKLRYRYLLAGVAWALFIAPVVTYFVAGVVLGILWLYVFGDSGFPAWLDWFVVVIFASVFISTAACSIYIVYRYGRDRETTVEDDDPRERRQALLLGFAPIVLIAITSAILWQRSVESAAAIAERERQEMSFTDLMNDRHAIDDLRVDRAGGDFDVRFTTSGGIPGPYSLTWQVNSIPYGEVLSRAEQDIALNEDARDLRFAFSIDELAQGYRDMIINSGGGGGGGGILVDEPFALVVTLRPVMDAGEMEGWPAFQRRLWEQGETPLASSVQIDFPVFFRLEKDGRITYTMP